MARGVEEGVGASVVPRRATTTASNAPQSAPDATGRSRGPPRRCERGDGEVVVDGQAGRVVERQEGEARMGRWRCRARSLCHAAARVRPTVLRARLPATCGTPVGERRRGRRRPSRVVVGRARSMDEQQRPAPASVRSQAARKAARSSGREVVADLTHDDEVERDASSARPETRRKHAALDADVRMPAHRTRACAMAASETSAESKRSQRSARRRVRTPMEPPASNAEP